MGQAGPRDLAVTFDDGLKSVRNALPVLTAYRIPYTLFVVSGWADGEASWHPELLMDWRDIEEQIAAGAAVGSHSVTHPDFSRLDDDEAEEELRRSRETIESRIGVSPTTFAIPLGQSNNWSAALQTRARAAGYDLVYAQSEGRRTEGTTARTFITKWDTDRVFRAALAGAFDNWEERP